jgi:hypothetical protein
VLNPTVPEWARLTLPILRRPAPAVLATAVTGVAFGLLEGVRVGVVTAAALAGFLLPDRLLAAALALGIGGALERRRQPERAGSGRLAEIHASRSPHQR